MVIKIYDLDNFKGEIRAINGPFSIAYFDRTENGCTYCEVFSLGVQNQKYF